MNVQDVLPRDAIPSIDDPAFGPTYFGDPNDEVIVVDGDPPRAYPIRVLSYHEIVNDTIDGRPIAVTWCPICWSAVVYDPVVDGRTLTFGTSGKLADDALVMYDRETESEWKQPTGAAIAGPLEGVRLPAIPAPVVSWERFVADNPDGVVLQPVRGDGTRSPDEVYDMDPYERYAEGGEFGLYGMRGEGERRSWDRTDIDAKTVVLGVEVGDEAVGYPVPRVRAAGGVVTDTVGSSRVVVFATDDGVHAFEDPGFDFERRDGSIRADGTTWDGATGESADGRALDRLASRRLFAFTWQDAHGRDSFYAP
ncbi:hypothetical protein C475_19258 [Halosimplex carlsbadense 2-9-1]|uniref:DUF3179 domain-containing protein n=1 Tax=Halosimplex carlsbadense 2-9-1 TaxID=797114 RepID=M0CER2_9EURY|nr:DUF3179 domain-containing protein [Halosimplex carlsbadense]ELZ21128.1 hypothetical protein C475_19258 [Halosimplex carlsbadense 2-9-1]